jgi:lyso-ornithine lipid O-acyltransferase
LKRFLPASAVGARFFPAARTAALAGWTFSLLTVRIALRPLGRISPVADRVIHRVFVRNWSRGALAILGVRVRTIGPRPPVGHFIVANHLSYLDILVFARETGSVFVAKKEMDGWPIVGFVVRSMNTIFVNRTNFRDPVRVNKLIDEHLEQGQSVMIFPEATTSYGDDVLPFKAALLEVPAKRNKPVHYAAIRFEKTDACPEPEHTVAWVDDTPFHKHAWRMIRTPRIDACVTFGTETVAATDRRVLAAELESRVRRLLPAMTDPARGLPTLAEVAAENSAEVIEELT